MKCPIDETVLVMSERQGIEIDYCPQCRGIWLDRGELDKLLDRAEEADRRDEDDDDRPEPRREERRPEPPRSDQPRSDQPRYEEPRYEEPRHRDERHHGGYGHKKKKRKSFLSEFLEFGD